MWGMRFSLREFGHRLMGLPFQPKEGPCAWGSGEPGTEARHEIHRTNTTDNLLLTASQKHLAMRCCVPGYSSTGSAKQGQHVKYSCFGDHKKYSNPRWIFTFRAL